MITNRRTRAQRPIERRGAARSVLLVLPLLLAAEHPAAASVQLGVDVVGVTQLGDAIAIDAGFGFGGRFGVEIPSYPILTLMPEIAVGYWRFGFHSEPGPGVIFLEESQTLSLLRLGAGARATIGAEGAFVRPFAYLHAGYVRVGFGVQGVVAGRYPEDSNELSASGRGFTTDVGVGLELQATSWLSLGIQAGYAFHYVGRVAGEGPFLTWKGGTLSTNLHLVELGAHARLRF